MGMLRGRVPSLCFPVVPPHLSLSLKPQVGGYSLSCWHDFWAPAGCGCGWGAHPGGASCTAMQVRTRGDKRVTSSSASTCLEACPREGLTPALQVPMGPAGFFHRVIKCWSPRGTSRQLLDCRNKEPGGRLCPRSGGSKACTCSPMYRSLNVVWVHDRVSLKSHCLWRRWTV